MARKEDHQPVAIRLDLYEALKESAEANERSIKKELQVIIKKALKIK